MPRSSASGSIGRRAGVSQQNNLSGQPASVGPRFSARDSPQPTRYSPHPTYQSPVLHQAAPISYASTGVRTAEEVEAEMRAQALARRAQVAQMQQQQQQKPPRMRSQSPSPYTIQQLHQFREQSPNILLQQQQLEQARMEELERQLQEQSLASRVQEQRLMELREAQAIQLEQAQLQQQMTSAQMRQVGEHRRQISGQASLADLQLIQQRLHAQALTGAVDPQLQKYFNQQVQFLRKEQQREREREQQLRIQNSQTHYGLQTPHQVQTQSQVMQSIQSVQLQQRLLAQLAQAEFSQSLGVSGVVPAGLNGNGNGMPHGVDARTQETLRAEAMRKISETERLEAKRRRKAAKIAHMVRFSTKEKKVHYVGVNVVFLFSPAITT